MSKDLSGLFLAHRRELQGYLTRKLHNPELAADLTQETFLRYAEITPKEVLGLPVVNVRSYLYRTAHNLAVDYVRQQARQQTDTATHEQLSGIPDGRASPEDAIDTRLKLDRMQQIVDELPERTRQVFVLNRIEGLTYAEVAETLEISASSVQKHLAKALQHVMFRIDPQ